MMEHASLSSRRAFADTQTLQISLKTQVFCPCVCAPAEFADSRRLLNRASRLCALAASLRDETNYYGMCVSARAATLIVQYRQTTLRAPW